VIIQKNTLKELQLKIKKHTYSKNHFYFDKVVNCNQTRSIFKWAFKKLTHLQGFFHITIAVVLIKPRERLLT